MRTHVAKFRTEKFVHELKHLRAAADISSLSRHCENSAVPNSSGTGMSQSLLVWRQNRLRRTGEQQDYVACQRARWAVEELARCARSQYEEFQKRANFVEPCLADFSAESSLRVFLNPIRIWTKFHTRAFLDDETDPPANVLFFIKDDVILAAYLELEAQVLVNELADYQPCTLRQWQSSTAFDDKDGLQEFLVDLARMGLVAFG